MTRLICSGLTLLALALHAFGQGQFWFIGATRLYSPDGPPAGHDIWAQMLVGRTADNLSAVGEPVAHSEGVALGGVVTVPGIPCFTVGVFSQMVVWDGRLWGSSLNNVPADQLGRTDIVPINLNCDPLPLDMPYFTQPAIVPVPEPLASALCVVGACILILHRRLRRPCKAKS